MKTFVHLASSAAFLTLAACSAAPGEEATMQSESAIIVQRSAVDAPADTNIIVQRNIDDATARGCTEHVFNRHFDLPANESEAAFLTPTYYAGNPSPVGLSLPFNVLHWHASFSTVANVPNDGSLSAYFRFLQDPPGPSLVSANGKPSALMMSISPGAVTTSLGQYFASYPGGSPVTNSSTLTARIMLLSGDLTLALTDANGHANCSAVTDATTPKGQWITLTQNCAAPPTGELHSGIALANTKDTGVVALIDSVSVCEASSTVGPSTY